MQALAKGARITGSQRSELAREYAERYAGGESIRSIAADSGRSFGFVHGVLSEAGVALRGRGGATRGGATEEPTPSRPQASAAEKKTSTTKSARAAEGGKKAAKKATTKTAKAPAGRKASTTKTASAPAARKKGSTTKPG